MSYQILQKMGFGLTREFASKIVMDYLQDDAHCNPFKADTPGADWWQHFLRRWPEPTERKPQHLSTSRARACSRESLDKWYEGVKVFFESTGFFRHSRLLQDIADRIWNCDETGFCLGVTRKKVLAKKGESLYTTLQEDLIGRTSLYIAADLHQVHAWLHVYILYKGVYLYKEWTIGGPAGSLYGVSDSGWMETKNFLGWFKKGFLPAVPIS